MGIIKRGILGGFSKKVGNVIGGSWKGIAYMRSQPLSVANPRTAGQVAQRLKFSTLVAIAQILLAGIIKPLMDRFAGQMSGFNYFVQQNIAAVSNVGAVTYANLKFSLGSLVGLTTTSATNFDGQSEVELTWSNNAGDGNALATDRVYAIAYNETQDKWAYRSSGAARSSEADDIEFEDDMATNDVIHVWTSMRRADGSLVSNTTYRTFTVTA